MSELELEARLEEELVKNSPRKVVEFTRAQALSTSDCVNKFLEVLCYEIKKVIY